ncbi:MAG: D-glycerate dehydrogenase [Phycisphaerales bacterium]|nr:D-glycerate dehydrogenase [Phycisphaerales bacterium]
MSHPHQAPPVVAVTAPLPGMDDGAFSVSAAAGMPVTLRVMERPAGPGPSRDDLLRFVAGASVVACMFTERVDAELLEAAGPGLKGVCAFAVGVDNIDLRACADRSVLVTNTPDAVTEGTANLALGLLLACTRRIVAADAFVRAGRFEREGNGFPSGWMGVHLWGRTLCIVGAGRIGYAVARRAAAFGMRVTYVARSGHLDFEASPLEARRVTLDEGLATADAVSLHTPFTPQTRHLIGARELALMKPTSVLVNTARGPVVDEQALVDALTRRAIWGAGLDVFEREPAVHPGLLTLDNCVLTPHIGSAEGFWRRRMTEMVRDNAAAIVAGRTPPNLVR